MYSTSFSILHRRLLDAAAAHHDLRESEAIAMLYLDHHWESTKTDVLLSKPLTLVAEEVARFDHDIERLAAGEPIQYVLGEAHFGGHRFCVTPSVLIPRPETEGLVQWVWELACGQVTKVLDAGTGSGCIAISLDIKLPLACVTAWDLSEAALLVAQSNAARLGSSVQFFQRDIMAEASAPTDEAGTYQFLVSNPPYIREREAQEMAPHVLLHEPHLALFVPDYDPLQFYRALGMLGKHLLTPDGALLVETNRAYTQQTAQLLDVMGYRAIEIRNDCFDVPRFVKALRP